MMIDFALDAERTRGLSHARRDLRGLPAALPPDHDDDDGGDAGRAAAGARRRRRRRDAPPARHRDRRRPALQPGADAVHDAGRLPLSRPVPPVGAVAARASATRQAPRRCATPIEGRSSRHMRRAAAATLARPRRLALAGCMVGPDYVRPDRARAGGVQGGGRAGRSRSRATTRRAGRWWEAFGDPDLNAPRERRSTSPTRPSPPPRRACARRRPPPQAARAATVPVGQRQCDARCAPRAATTTTGAPAASPTATTRRSTSSWEIDLWGRIRRGVEASERRGAGERRRPRRARRCRRRRSLAQDYLLLRVQDARDRSCCATPSPATSARCS